MESNKETNVETLDEKFIKAFLEKNIKENTYKTSMEWVEKQMIDFVIETEEQKELFSIIIQGAKECEKIQIESAYTHGFIDGIDNTVTSLDPEKYYNERYGK